MLKYVESAVTFSELPNEISLCINLSLCPNHCPGCSESYLAEDIGEPLDYDAIDHLVHKNKGITAICFMCGDNDHDMVYNLARYVHDKYKLKVGMYSGRDYLDFKLAEILDYYKIGPWKMFKGPKETWRNQTAGPICLPTSNQIMFKREKDKLINITEEFRKNPIHDWESTIIK